MATYRLIKPTRHAETASELWLYLRTRVNDESGVHRMPGGVSSPQCGQAPPCPDLRTDTPTPMLPPGMPCLVIGCGGTCAWGTKPQRCDRHKPR